jgi:hypothetical protein
MANGRLFISYEPVASDVTSIELLEWAIEQTVSIEKEGFFLRHVRFNDCRNRKGDDSSYPSIVMEFYPEGYKG